MKSIDMKRFVLSSLFKFNIKVSGFIGVWDDKIEWFLKKNLEEAPVGFKYCGALSIDIQTNKIGSALFNAKKIIKSCFILICLVLK